MAPPRRTVVVALALVVLLGAVLPGVLAYVYPLHPAVGGRARTPNAHTPAAFNNANALLSTADYAEWGARISSARYTHNNGAFVATAEDDCARMLNQDLLGHNANGLQGLATRLQKFKGMVGLAVVRAPPNAINPLARTIYWTVSGTVNPDDQATIDQVTTDMNALMATLARASQVNDRWVFLGPDQLIPGSTLTPTQACLQHSAPQQVNAPQPVNPMAAIAAAKHQSVTPTNRAAAIAQANLLANTQGNPFCLRSHPFAAFTYRQRRSLDGAKSVNQPANVFYDFNVVNPTGADKGNMLCSCAGSRLGAALRTMGVFSRPGAIVRGYSKGYWEAEESWRARMAAQTAANDRVVCFAEALNLDAPAPPHNKVYEQNQLGRFDTFPTAASCTTCQVQMQLIYGNQLVDSAQCAGNTQLQQAYAAGANNWAAMTPDRQSRSFVAIDEHMESESDDTHAHAHAHTHAHSATVATAAASAAADPLGLAHATASKAHKLKGALGRIARNKINLKADSRAAASASASRD